MRTQQLTTTLAVALQGLLFVIALQTAAFAELQHLSSSQNFTESSVIRLQSDPSLLPIVKQELKASIQAQAAPKPELGIVGAEFWVPEGQAVYPRISQIFPDSPAQRAGLNYGDWLLAIDGVACKGWSRTQLDRAISNIPGTKHQLLVFRSGQPPLSIQLQVASLLQASARLKQYYVSLHSTL